MDLGYIIIISFFIIYHIVLLVVEQRFLVEPRDIMDKFLSFVLLYAGFSIMYFSITGKPFLNDSPETYNIYIFIIGFIALMWAIPNLLLEFKFFSSIAKKNHLKKK
jgi:hypothetical protein